MTGGRRAQPRRTCIACRQSRPQGELLRLVRTAAGAVEADQRRRAGGRGAYLCARDKCLAEAVRRNRWAHAFRAPATMSRETAGELRGLIGPGGDERAPAGGRR
jgi:hypothetical protein